ncbi:MAG: hypothetical protein EOM68_31605, partial [Spirochaetia bacterium]|nr:hypothetical protein [Spirochaetia bacterium]
APKSSPILRQILDVTERGRSLGVILFAAEQFRSSIHDRVKGNCSTHAYGRTNSIETSKADYKIGQMTEMVKGKDVVVFATGIMVQQSMDAAKILEKEGISIRVVNVSTIKPLDRNALEAYCEGVKRVVTAEEHSVFGGLGSAVCTALSKKRLPIEVLGVQDSFGTSAENYSILLKHYGLESEDVAKKVRAVLSAN